MSIVVDNPHFPGGKPLVQDDDEEDDGPEPEPQPAKPPPSFFRRRSSLGFSEWASHIPQRSAAEVEAEEDAFHRAYSQHWASKISVDQGELQALGLTAT